MHHLPYCMRLLLLFYFSILDCDNPVWFWSWRIDVVAGRQNANGVGVIAFVRLGHATRRGHALFLVEACGPWDTREWYGVYKRAMPNVGFTSTQACNPRLSCYPSPPALIPQDNLIHP